MWSFCLLALATSAAAVPATHPHVVHEKRSSYASQQYVKRQPVERDAIIPVRIGLVQSNLDRGYEHLMDVSHPSSANYGKHWTSEEVDSMFAPSTESIDLVSSWLIDNGVINAKTTIKGGWIVFDAPVTQVEDLFHTRFHEYESSTDNAMHIGVEEYSLPYHISQHVDYITPGVKLSSRMTKSVVRRDEGPRNSAMDHRGGRWPHPGPPSWQSNSAPWSLAAGTTQLTPDLRSCGLNITPPCLQALYNIPAPNLTIDNGVLGVFEFSDTYSQKNLDKYFATYAPYVPQGTAPELVSVNGAKAPVKPKSRKNGGESDVDLDIIFSLIGPQPVTLYQVQPPSGLKKTATNNILTDYILDAVDGSYCTAEDRAAGADCGTVALTEVLSASYGLPEVHFPFKAQNRACNEFMKLGLQGHTIVYSSGDYGVAGNPGGCKSNGCIPRTAKSTNPDVLNPEFPASCPYVLSVGATQLNPSDTVQSPESSMFQPDLGIQQLINCSNPTTIFSSGGGFSNMFKRPDYQADAVNSYFAQHDPGYPYYHLSGNQIDKVSAIPAGIYNRIGRAIPDVSANGAQFNIFIQNKETQEAGTSLATPIWAAILAMISQKRKECGKGCLGFINPVLYENAHIFHDIVKGNNPGCGTNGFSAVPGWDPVTGLGTPDYPSLEALFLSLP